MREKKRDIKPRHKIEKENSGNERVFGRDKVKHQHSDAGDRLPQTQPVGTQQFILDKIIFRPA